VGLWRAGRWLGSGAIHAIPFVAGRHSIPRGAAGAALLQHHRVGRVRRRRRPRSELPVGPEGTNPSASSAREWLQRPSGELLWQGGGEGAAAVLCGYARQQDTEHAGVKGEDNPAAYLFFSV